MKLTPSSIANNENETWVGFDLDDCLINMREPLCDAMQRHTGKSMHWSTWNNYDFYQDHMDVSTFLDLIVKEGVVDMAMPEPGAADILQELRNRGIKTAVVTARGYLPDAQAATQRSLDRHGLIIDKLVVVAPGQTKVDALMALPNLIGYVDDHARHLDDVRKSFDEAGLDIHLSLVDRPWNQHSKAHNRISDIKTFTTCVLNLHLQSEKSNQIFRQIRP